MPPDATAFTLAEIVARLGAATLCGLAPAFEREWRAEGAGLRTHALVALSAAVVTTSALSLYAGVRREGGDADPLRVIRGLAQTIGFIAAGTIFVAHRTVTNLTTAASVWLSASAGIVAGAAQFTPLAVAMGFGLTILIVLRLLGHFSLPSREE